MKNIFVLALDDFNHRLLKTIRGSEEIRFHSLLGYEDVVKACAYPMADLMEKAEKHLQNFSGSIDGIICYWDFPASTMAPILQRKYGLKGATFESVLRCEHKYWSRIVQKEAVPEVIPRFCAVNPFADAARSQVGLNYPFWIKPVRAHSSCLGFLIENDQDFTHALAEIRKRIHRFGKPFNHLLSYAVLPDDVAEVDGFHCVAEEIIAAQYQCTLEGFVQGGRVHVYGIVDSLRAEGGSSFTRYQYPSQLPLDVQQRMIDFGSRLVSHIGLDDSPFNIEFFYDPEKDRLQLLEINARISKSHCPLFFHVEGASHQEVAVDLALGREVNFPRGEGEFALAAKFMLRRYENARVTAVPDEKEIARARDEVSGALIRVLVKEGELLSALEDQDSYSYEYAEIFIGADDQKDLERKYARIMEMLDFRFAPVT